MIRTAPPVRNRHLVREIDRGRLRELLLVTGLVILVLVPLLAYVWNHMEWIRIGYEMESLKQERAAQAQLADRLRIEKASLESLARVEREARDRLGLVPAAGAIVMMESEPPASVARAEGEALRQVEPAPAPAGVPR